MQEVLKAKNYLARSSAKIVDIKSILRTGSPSSTLELCDEAIELALEACSVLSGLPLKGKPRDVILNNKDKFPEWFIEKFQELFPSEERPKEALECLKKAEELNDLVWKLVLATEKSLRG